MGYGYHHGTLCSRGVMGIMLLAFLQYLITHVIVPLVEIAIIVFAIGAGLKYLKEKYLDS